MIRRPPRSTQSRSSAASDVYKRQEAMFDGVVGRYDITNTIITAGHDNYWRWRTTRALGARSGATVLDVAAGTGRSTRSLQRAGAHVVACDISSRMLAAAR